MGISRGARPLIHSWASGAFTEDRQEAASGDHRDPGNDVPHRIVGVAAGQRVGDLVDRRLRRVIAEEQKHRADDKNGEADGLTFW